MTETTELAPPRDAARRRRDTEHRLEHDIDLWVATAAGDTPYLVPLSFDWDGEAILLSTPVRSVTGRNLARTGTVRLALGHTRDVVMIEGTVEVLPMDALPAEVGDRFARRAGFDPREDEGYAWFRVTPQQIHAWREVNELAGREIMRDGRWLA